MITAEKQFGRYVLKPATEIFSSEIEDDPEQLSQYYEDVVSYGEAMYAVRYPPCSIPPKWTLLKLIKVKRYNHNTNIFSFALKSNKSKLGLPPGAFLFVKAPGCEHGGGDAIRPYAATSDPGIRGSFDIMVKRYDAWGTNSNGVGIMGHSVNPYRPPGVVSNYIFSLKIGEELAFKHSRACRSKLSTILLLGKNKKNVVDDSPVECKSSPVILPSPPKRPNQSQARPTRRGREVKTVMDTFKSTNELENESHSDDSDSEVDPDELVDSMTIIAVGAGIGPIIQILRTSLYGQSLGDASDDYLFDDVHNETWITPGGIIPTLEERSKMSSNQIGVVGSSESSPLPLSSSPNHWNSDKSSHWMTKGGSHNDDDAIETDKDNSTNNVAGNNINCKISSNASTPPRSRSRSGSMSKFASNVRISVALNTTTNKLQKIVLLYGARTVEDILYREQLQQFQSDFPDRFKVVFCIGSRYDNVHMGAKSAGVGSIVSSPTLTNKSEDMNTVFHDTFANAVAVAINDNSHGHESKGNSDSNSSSKGSEYIPPSVSKDFQDFNALKEVGWVGYDHIEKHQALSPLMNDAVDGIPGNVRTRAVVCGLPAVYEKLCGSRFDNEVPKDSVLGCLGYDSSNVLKL
jgi:ferredoxin-NADP reductase